jgi:hypothetical protein
MTATSFTLNQITRNRGPFDRTPAIVRAAEAAISVPSGSRPATAFGPRIMLTSESNFLRTASLLVLTVLAWIHAAHLHWWSSAVPAYMTSQADLDDMRRALMLGWVVLGIFILSCFERKVVEIRGNKLWVGHRCLVASWGKSAELSHHSGVIAPVNIDAYSTYGVPESSSFVLLLTGPAGTCCLASDTSEERVSEAGSRLTRATRLPVRRGHPMRGAIFSPMDYFR